MKENSEMLAQQAKPVSVQVGSGPTIELVTPEAGKGMEARGIICPPNCMPCPPLSCEPRIFPRPPEPPKPPWPPKPPPN